jgi:hypothetical protein
MKVCPEKAPSEVAKTKVARSARAFDVAPAAVDTLDASPGGLGDIGIRRRG